MKKIFNILTLALFATVAFTSCDDDDVYVEDPTANQLAILSRETSFGAAPSQGTIVVDTNEPITVTSNDQTGWITTSVDGNKVNVNVALNESLDGRTAMLTIKGGSKQAQVAVIQSGVIVALDGENNVKYNDNARTVTFNLKSNLPVEIWTDADWITPTYEDGVITATLTANATKHVRVGTISYTAGPVNEEITITQLDFTKDLAGSWYLFFVDGEDGKTKYANVELKKTGTKYTMEAFGLSIPLTYNTSTLDLRVAAGSYLGDLSAYKLHTLLWDIDAGYVTWSTAASMSADWSCDEEEGEGTVSGEFIDNGSWGSHIGGGLIIGGFTATPPTSAGYKADALAMAFPTLVRLYEVTPAQASNAASVAKSYAATSKAKRIASFESAVPYEFTGLHKSLELSVDE